MATRSLNVQLEGEGYPNKTNTDVPRYMANINLGGNLYETCIVMATDS